MRYCVINQELVTKLWIIGFFDNSSLTVKATISISNYHDIGSWISNWIANGILPKRIE